MRWFIVFYFSVQSGWAGYGNYASHGSAAASNYGATSSGMTLSTERIETRIAPFMHDTKQMSDDIERDWYKRDENDHLLDPKASYKDNILKILLKQLIEHFGDDTDDRIDTIKRLLEFINDFIAERFVPGAHQDVLKKTFSHIQGLQHKPAMQVTNVVFDALSEDAQAAFRDTGVRVQTNSLDRASTGQNATPPQADPILVEILFLQLVWDAEKRNGTRQELLNTLEKNMTKMEKLFGNDSAYTIVGSFESLRSTLVEQAQKESPLPELIRFMISLIKDGKKELEREHQDLLDNKAREAWKEITKTKAKPAVSIWLKKEESKKPTEAESRRQEEEKKKEKSQIKNKLNEVKNRGLAKATETLTASASSTFDGLIGSFSKSLSGIFG